MDSILSLASSVWNCFSEVLSHPTAPAWAQAILSAIAIFFSGWLAKSTFQRNEIAHLKRTQHERLDLVEDRLQFLLLVQDALLSVVRARLRIVEPDSETTGSAIPNYTDRDLRWFLSQLAKADAFHISSEESFLVAKANWLLNEVIRFEGKFRGHYHAANGLIEIYNEMVLPRLSEFYLQVQESLARVRLDRVLLGERPRPVVSIKKPELDKALADYKRAQQLNSVSGAE